MKSRQKVLHYFVLLVLVFLFEPWLWPLSGHVRRGYGPEQGQQSPGSPAGSTREQAYRLNNIGVAEL